jgi:RecB family exonuclease
MCYHEDFLDLSESTMIKTWSYSRLTDFEKCKYLAKLKYLDKVPEPERPLPPGKTEHANDRGTRIHEAAELYVRGGVELIPELEAFRTRLDWLREQFAQGRVSLEGEWAMTKDWSPTAWASSDTWVRLKLDAFVNHGDGTGLVIDYKTGRRAGNEVKHTEQGQLYQLVTFMRYPELERLDVEFWYTDLASDNVDHKTYTREQGLQYIEKFEKRGIAITSCVEFNPNPNKFSCRWCPYLGNACDKGIR